MGVKRSGAPGDHDKTSDDLSGIVFGLVEAFSLKPGTENSGEPWIKPKQDQNVANGQPGPEDIRLHGTIGREEGVSLSSKPCPVPAP